MSDFELTNGQKQAIDMFVDFLHSDTEDKMIISGESGTGKTEVIRNLLQVARSQHNLMSLIDPDTKEIQILLTATTNKAAKVLSDATGESVRTIHSTLGLQVYDDYQTGTTRLKKTKEYNIVENHLIVVEEASMADRTLTNMILESTIRCKLLIVGDDKQILPVFEKTCPIFEITDYRTHLDEIVRQENKSPIAALGKLYRATTDTGDFPIIVPDNKFIFQYDKDDFKLEIEKTFTTSNPTNFTKAIAWSNKRVHQYNDYLNEHVTGHKTFQVGQNIVTNKPIIAYDAVTGGSCNYTTDSILEITAIHEDTALNLPVWKITLNNEVIIEQPKNIAQVGALMKTYKRNKDWTNFFEVKNRFADVRPIYASTVNKAQGSTYNTVFIDLPDIGRNNKWWEVSRLLYVAITRATDKVVFFGELPPKYRG